MRSRALHTVAHRPKFEPFGGKEMAFDPAANIEVGVQILKDKTLDGSTPMINQTLSTGTATPALTANKPGASTAISTWLQITVNGTNYVVPLYLPT